MEEAGFLLVKELNSNKDGLESCRDTCCRWLMEGELEPEEALIWRSMVHAKAKAYLQAREDARVSLGILSERWRGGEVDAPAAVFQNTVTSAYRALGVALFAEEGYPDRDSYGALKALTKALHCWDGLSLGKDQDLYDLVQDVTESLTKEDVDRAMQHVAKEGYIVGGCVGDRVKSSAGVSLRVDVCLSFENPATNVLTPFCREQLRALVARAGGTELNSVGIERVRMTGAPGDRRSISVQLHVDTEAGADEVRERLAAYWSGSTANGVPTLEGTGEFSEVVSLLGEALEVEVAELADDPGRGAHESGPSDTANETRLIEPAAPKMELTVPFKDYKLVDAVGNPVARQKKHAFCMSRVYYDRSEIQNETWVELSDGSCRWRQSSSEIKLIVLSVPSDTPSKEICIQFEPYNIVVGNKVTGETYLSGKLHRGIIPNECFWTHMGGCGEDGCLVTMTKMNLEVLQKHWMHSEMWWSKLFDHHPDIAWDDYEKDYSDLPAEVMERHRIKEAQKEETRQLESKDERRRKRLNAEDDRRKRNRMQRLGALREGRA
jgi:hypothetical protein